MSRQKGDFTMSVKKYRFVSPGVFLKEIDQSQLPKEGGPVGPAVIGRTQRGPGMRPVTVNSFLEFVELFGNPVPGGEGGDIWRDGNRTSTMYAPYAARAWLKSSTPLTVVRVLGEDNRAATTDGQAGWETEKTSLTVDSGTNGGAMGLWVADYTASASSTATLTLDDNTMEEGDPLVLDGASTYTFTCTASLPDAPNKFAKGGTAKASADAIVAIIAASASTDFTAIATATGPAGSPNSSATVTITSVLEDADANLYSLTSSLTGTSPANTLFSGGADDTVGAGTLAAIWYLNEGSIRLKGENTEGTDVESTCELIKSDGPNFQFKAIIENETSGSVLTASFNFDKGSDFHIRKVFNTDPTLLGPVTSDTSMTYFLGETFERNLYDVAGSDATATGRSAAFIAGINSGASRKVGSQAAETGMIISQKDLSDNSHPLFQLKALDSGEWANSNVKISITDIAAPRNPDFNEYGTFTVEVRDGRDTDANKIVLETFSGCNLDPNSADFISVKIGDKYATWSDTERRFTEFGDYNNQSRYIYVAMGYPQDASLLPFGFEGPQTFQHASGTLNDDTGLSDILSTTIPHVASPGVISGNAGTSELGFNFQGPKMALRVSSSTGGFSDPTLAYFGLTTDQRSNGNFERSYIDLSRYMPTSVEKSASFTFTLDDVAIVSGSDGVENQAYYASGLYDAGDSISAGGPSLANPDGTTARGYDLTLDAGFNKFTVPLAGGFDGFDIFDKEPIANSRTDGKTEYNDYAFNSVKRAIDTVADPEVVDINLATVPGVTNSSLTTHLMNVCEERADALAIVDLEGGYETEYENNNAASSRVGSVDTTVGDLKTRALNNSYACTYYPWVQTKDEFGSGKILWVPPSIAALGTFASTDKKSAPWFAPAGFTRGGLSDGAAGIPVIGVREHLTRKMRDKLYENNVNPIAKFPAEGIVIFGQKTLQATPSALDRVNVRRMMLYVKKGISNISSRLLFGSNTEASWNRFIAQADPFLRELQSQLGLTDYKIVLDKTTTTPDLIDRNIMYAKIFLQPARSIEFIAIDFVIQRTGASFDD